MKYIIDIPNELAEATARYWSETTDMTLVPYTEPDRKAIENEVWELASKLIWTFTERECKQMFGMEAVYVPRDMPYSEAKSKYEVWKKQKEDEAIMKEVTALAEKIGIHKLYATVKEIRGE